MFEEESKISRWNESDKQSKLIHICSTNSTIESFINEFDDESDSDDCSSDSLDSIFDYTTCFDLLDQR